MTGEKSDDLRVFETAGGKCLVEEVGGSSAKGAARFGLLARSLLADARFVRCRKMSLSRWANFYYKQIDTYFTADRDNSSRNDCM